MGERTAWNFRRYGDNGRKLTKTTNGRGYLKNFKVLFVRFYFGATQYSQLMVKFLLDFV